MQDAFNFAADDKLLPAIAARMQAVADCRAGAGFRSDDGKTHINAECRALYDAGHPTNSVTYRKALARAQR